MLNALIYRTVHFRPFVFRLLYLVVVLRASLKVWGRKIVFKEGEEWRQRRAVLRYLGALVRYLRA